LLLSLFYDLDSIAFSLTEIKKDQEKIISISYREYGNKGIQSLKKEVTRLKVYVTDIEKHFNDIERGEEMEVEDMLE
jgi:hypothetical protein